jgi:phosphate transport system substrate-binding protein
MFGHARRPTDEPGKIAVLLAVWMLTLGLVGCAGEDEPSGPSRGARPPVVVAADGSPLLVPMMLRAARLYRTAEPGVEVTIRQSGTEEGFDALCAGATSIALASRPIEPAEEALCRANGNIIRALPLANEGLAVVAHPALGVDCLTTGQLRRLWRAGSSVREYRALGPDLPAERVAFVGLHPESESFSFFTRAVTGREGSMRDEFSPTGESSEVIGRVASTPGVVGFVGFAELARRPPSVRTVAIDAGRGCVRPTRATIQTRRYRPLARPLSAYVNLERLRIAKVRKFMALTVARHDALVGGAGVVPMGPEQVLRARRVVGRPRPAQAQPAR